MPSPEHGFRIREFRAPDKTGGGSSGSSGQENQRTNHLSETKPSLPSQENLIADHARARRSLEKQAAYLPRLAGGQESKKQEGPRKIGRADFSWRRQLSEDGKKLYLLLLKEMGDRDRLPTYASEDEFDLNAALDELRKHGLLDEDDPERVKLISTKL